MFRQVTHKPDDENDIVDRAAASLRDAATPDGPSPELLATTLAAIQHAQARRQTSIRRRFLPMKTLTRLAIAAVLILFVGILVYTGTGGGQMAFAQVLEKVNQVHSVRFKAIAIMKEQLAPNAPKSTEMTMTIRDNRMREEMPFGGVMIMDPQAGQVLTLDRANKTAVRMSLKNAPKKAYEQNVLEQFRRMGPEKGKPLGRKDVDGKPADGFHVEQAPGYVMTIWADPKTHLPVRIEAVMENAMIPKSELTMKDFEWDVPVNDADFSLDAPEGYKLQTLSFDLSDPSEKDVIDALRALVTFNDGQFPDRFDIFGVSAAVARKYALAGKKPDPKDPEMMKIIMGATRAMTFVKPEHGSDFHYAGKGAKLGEANRPILWYKPAGSETYRVIDADLTVHADVPAVDLPKIESMELKPFPAQPPAATKPSR